MEYRWAHGQDERLPDLAAELVQLPVEVLVAVLGAPAAGGPARDAHRPYRLSGGG